MVLLIDFLFGESIEYLLPSHAIWISAIAVFFSVYGFALRKYSETGYSINEKTVTGAVAACAAFLGVIVLRINYNVLGQRFISTKMPDIAGSVLGNIFAIIVAAIISAMIDLFICLAALKICERLLN